MSNTQRMHGCFEEMFESLREKEEEGEISPSKAQTRE